MTKDPLSQLRLLIDEAQLIHQLNFELLDVLAVILKKMTNYCNKANIPFDASIISLLHKATTVYDEIHSTNQPTVISTKRLSDEILHNHKTDKDFTEPIKDIEQKKRQRYAIKKRQSWDATADHSSMV